MFKKVFYFKDNIKSEVNCESIFHSIIIKYFNKDIEFYETSIDSYPFVYTDAGLFDLAYNNIPRVHIKRKKIIEDLL